MLETHNTCILKVALRLLDAEFPDENVRAFALRILDKLPDDQLEGFLLQLTQVLHVMFYNISWNCTNTAMINSNSLLGCEI